ncbi:hypothetical protein A3Q56_02240 [Intoshia linei]|uniref:Uncharacterized protein n=1 Tax=Intoshia linei TaxID=1819745 RepID=A0A177B8U4_9BILA|nr:hypothetical protein A3Q56_02240 [Intoshia linei]
MVVNRRSRKNKLSKKSKKYQNDRSERRSNHNQYDTYSHVPWLHPQKYQNGSTNLYYPTNFVLPKMKNLNHTMIPKILRKNYYNIDVHLNIQKMRIELMNSGKHASNVKKNGKISQFQKTVESIANFGKQIPFEHMKEMLDYAQKHPKSPKIDKKYKWLKRDK